MARERRLIRELMIWAALVALGLGALDFRARQKSRAIRQAAERTAALNAHRAAGQSLPFDTMPPATAESKPDDRP